MSNRPILLLDNVSRVHGRDETAVRALDAVTAQSRDVFLTRRRSPSWIHRLRSTSTPISAS